ncbi:MAG: cysteine hydrolase family protein [Bryobacteraceae bacterium]
MVSKHIELLSDREWPSDAFAVSLPIRRETAALGVIDMQHYALNPASDLIHTVKAHREELYRQFAAEAGIAVANTARLIECFRGARRRVVYTRHGMLLPDGADLVVRRRGREAAALESMSGHSGHLPLRGTAGHQIVDELAPLPGELVLDKNTSSAFNSTSIEMFLRNMGVDTLVLTGVASDQCVFATALDAADRGFHVIIASDATAGFDPGSTRAVQILFGRVWGYVMETSAVIRWMETGEKPSATRHQVTGG